MQTPIDPRVDDWYQDLDAGHTFKVMSIDDAGIAVQHYDGTVAELSADEWRTLNLAQASRPVDWTGPMDGVVAEGGRREETGVAAEDDINSGPGRV